MISWSSQIWFLSPLNFFFYVFVFFSSKVQVRTSFYFLYYFFCSYVFSFNAFVLCYGDLVEVEPSHLTI